MLLSRMIDFYYTPEAWQKVFRTIILSSVKVGGKDFLEAFLDHLIGLSVISSPLSLERRGIILYEYCREHCPQFLQEVTMAWVEAGMSLKKSPAEKIFRVKRLARFVADTGLEAQVQACPDFRSVQLTVTPDGHLSPEDQVALSSAYRLYWLPTGGKSGILYGFDAAEHTPYPVLKYTMH